MVSPAVKQVAHVLRDPGSSAFTELFGQLVRLVTSWSSGGWRGSSRSPRRKEVPGHSLLCETLSLEAEHEVFRELPFLPLGGEQDEMQSQLQLISGVGPRTSMAAQANQDSA